MEVADNKECSSTSSSKSSGSLRTIVCKIHSEGMKTLTETELRLLKSYGETSSVPNESIRQVILSKVYKVSIWSSIIG